MPLYPDAKARMRANLLAVQAGQKVRSMAIGWLTETQLKAINDQRQQDELPLVIAEVLFVGGHVYRSRVVKDGYGIEDIIEEAESALSAASEVLVTSYMTALQIRSQGQTGSAIAYTIEQFLNAPGIDPIRNFSRCNRRAIASNPGKIRGGRFRGPLYLFERLARVTGSSGSSSRPLKE
jgi:hypothetical protein